MMNVLILRANPRKAGVSQRLADLIVEGLNEEQAEVCDINLCASRLEFCKGCFACSSSGKCVINDDMASIIEKVKIVDAIVCVSPLYFFSMSAQMKVFFDRLFPLVSNSGTFTGNAVDSHISSLKGKKFVTVSVALGRASVFDSLTATYKAISDCAGFDWIANIRRGESAYFLEDSASSRRMAKILSAFKNLGKGIARGEISDDTITNAELAFSESDEAFAKRASLFWRVHSTPRDKKD